MYSLTPSSVACILPEVTLATEGWEANPSTSGMSSCVYLRRTRRSVIIGNVMVSFEPLYPSQDYDGPANLLCLAQRLG